MFIDEVMATHSSTIAWKIPWTEEPGGLQSMGLQRVGHNWATSLSLSLLFALTVGNTSEPTEGLVREFSDKIRYNANMGFPGNSTGKESICNAGDPS